jgi:hypothetical protein
MVRDIMLFVLFRAQLDTVSNLKYILEFSKYQAKTNNCVLWKIKISRHFIIKINKFWYYCIKHSRYLFDFIC